MQAIKKASHTTVYTRQHASKPCTVRGRTSMPRKRINTFETLFSTFTPSQLSWLKKLGTGGRGNGPHAKSKFNVCTLAEL